MSHDFFSVVWSSTQATRKEEKIQRSLEFTVKRKDSAVPDDTTDGVQSSGPLPPNPPFVGVFDEQTGQQRLGVCRQSARELDVLHQDELKQLLMVLVVERQPATHHLIGHHTQTPPVHRPTVVVVLQDLWGGEGRRSEEKRGGKKKKLRYATSAFL